MQTVAKFRDGTVLGLYNGLMDTGSPGSVFGENSFYRKTCGTRRGGRHVANSSSDTREVYPNVKVQVQDLVRVVGIVAPFGPRGGGRYPGRIRFIHSQGVNGQRRPVPCVPSSGLPRKSQAKFRDGIVWGL